MINTGNSCKLSLHQAFMMFALSCLLLPCFSSAGLAQTYTITDLGTLPGGLGSAGAGINASGQVTGWSYTDSTTDHPHAFIYTPGANPAMIDLGDLGGNYSTGASINASGQVTGWSHTPANAEHVFFYDGTMTDLRPGSFGNSNGFGINDSGWITGTMNMQGGGTHAFLYNPGTQSFDDLTPNDPFGIGNAINPSGWVTGYYGQVATAHAFLYRYGVLTDLYTLPGGTYSIGHGINASGQITGWGNTPGGEHAFLYSNGTMTDIDTNGNQSQGNAINACGQIVGARNGQAFLYTAKQGFVNLTGVLSNGSGWSLASASSINDRGQITGFGYYNGEEHAYLLTPNSYGDFVCTGSMQTARMQHTATLLSGGNTVLITGGAGASGAGSLNSAETYDISTGSFATLSETMQSRRYAHTATLLNDMSVLIAGGYETNGAGYLSTAELYDPIEPAFVLVGQMSSPRQEHTATLLNDGKVLIAGGIGGALPLASTEVYDPVSKAFTPTASMSSRRYGHAATLLANGKVLITGGCTGGNPDCLNTAEVYDPVANTFTLTNPMQDVHAWHTATLLGNGTVLIAGGNQGNVIANAEIYDPSTNTFTAANPMVSTTAYYDTATTLLDGRVVMAGGTWGAGTTDQAQLYNPLTGTFSLVGGTMSSSRRYHTATLLPNGKVLLAGGLDANNTVLASADLYQAPESITQTLSSNGGTAPFVFENNLFNIVFDYPKNLVADGSKLTVTPMQTSQAAWAQRTLTSYTGTQLAPVAGLGGDGIIYEAVCVGPNGGTCSLNPDLSYTIVTSWKGPAGNDPGFLKAEIGTNNWENVFVSYSPTRLDGGPDPTGSGKSGGGWSDWAFVYNVTQPSGTVAPTVSITAPANNATYVLKQQVNAGYTCSGTYLLDCLGDVKAGTPFDTSSIGTKTFTVVATVTRGQSASQTVNYVVSAYNACLLYDSTRSVKSGATYPIKFYLCDANGSNLSSAGIAVTATSYYKVGGSASTDLMDAGNSNPDNNFRFSSDLYPGGGYIFNYKTTGLHGVYWLNFTISGDTVGANHSVEFQVK